MWKQLYVDLSDERREQAQKHSLSVLSIFLLLLSRMICHMFTSPESILWAHFNSTVLVLCYNCIADVLHLSNETFFCHCRQLYIQLSNCTASLHIYTEFKKSLSKYAPVFIEHRYQHPSVMLSMTSNMTCNTHINIWMITFQNVNVEDCVC